MTIAPLGGCFDVLHECVHCVATGSTSVCNIVALLVLRMHGWCTHVWYSTLVKARDREALPDRAACSLTGRRDVSDYGVLYGSLPR